MTKIGNTLNGSRKRAISSIGFCPRLFQKKGELEGLFVHGKRENLTLSKEQRKKIYMRVFRRYKKLAQKLGENWKKVKIKDLTFKEAYEKELKREEIQATNFRPSRNPEDYKKWKGVSVRKKHSELDWLAKSSDAKREGASAHSESCDCPLCSGGYGELHESEMTGIENLYAESKKEEEKPIFTQTQEEEKFAFKMRHEAKIKEIVERGKWLERQKAEIVICPICKSSCCHCKKEENPEGGEE